MPLADGSHVSIDGVGYFLDEGYEQDLGRRCYVHGARSIFAEQFTITGKPGAQNLRAKDLKWHITDWTGEGQVVLNNDDPDSATRFRTSEGLDFRTPGQVSLNKSTIAQYPAVGAPSATTFEGNADFEDVTGTSTGSGTDRELDTVADKVQTDANHAPGAGQVQLDFYLYRQRDLTTIEGSSLVLAAGKGATNGTDFRLRQGRAWTAKRVTGTHFTAGVTQSVTFHVSPVNTLAVVQALIHDVTNPEQVKVVTSTAYLVATAANTLTLTFTPAANKEYRFSMVVQDDNFATIIDKIEYGNSLGTNTATLQVWNNTGSSVVASRVVSVTADAAGAKVASIVFTAAAATNYRYRVERTSGPQDIWVDKVVATIQGTANYVLDDIGLGAGGLVWMAGHTAGADVKVWTYDVTNDDWDEKAVLNEGSATQGFFVRAMAHSDSRQYFLVSDGSNNDIYSVTTAGADEIYASFTTAERTLVGLCVAQERLFALAEDTSGVRIYSMPLDSTGGTVPYDLAGDASVLFVDIAAGSKTPDTTLRQRMVGTNSGARFFINYSDVTPRVYNVDSSGSVLNVTELAPLDSALKISSIAFTGGVTLLAGQYQAESDQTPQSVLWAIEANGVPERIGFFRYEAPSSAEPVFIVPYQTDVYILQGKYVWRYSIGFTGGLYLEYELNGATVANARSLAVNQGRTFALFTTEVWVTGSEGTYRQAALSGGNTFVTSVYDFGLPGISKSLNKVTVLTADADSSLVGVRVSYEVDEEGTTTLLGSTGSGSKHEFSPSDAVTFTALKLTVTLESLDGTATPAVRGVVVAASALEREEYFDLVLLTGDTTPTERIAGEQPLGSAKAAALVSAWRSGSPVNLIDGYLRYDPRAAESYRCLIEDIRVEQTKAGEGRAVTTLRVL
jgi:hypothetical protein